MAIETPEIFPNPTVAAKTAERDWNLDIPILSSLVNNNSNALLILSKGYPLE